jgi:UDP-N-acetylglucosamine--N-acetylmuramyl-(pentapeptide) pyrophosphoryl-undecaprenol N-acetylglucosamine transferase
MNSIVFAAGGTGGHIFPAIAVADEIKKLRPETKICFIGAAGKMEEKVVPENGYELETINIRGFSRSLNFRNLQNLIRLPIALRDTRQILGRHSPDVVFATGGYVSGPVVWQAAKSHVPSILYEGNYFPGLTTRLLQSKADAILINFADSKNLYTDQEKIYVMPYPVRKKLKRHSKEAALNFFGLSPVKKTVFIFGGSQGAISINNAVSRILGQLTDANVQLIWQTGEKDYEKIMNLVRQTFLSVKIFRFINQIDYAYSAADLVVCRSGISAVMEVACFGIPAIFIPYPHSTDDHQTYNARILSGKDAAELIYDKNLDDELGRRILSLLRDESRLTQLGKNVKGFYQPNAAEQIASFLLGFDIKGAA